METEFNTFHPYPRLPLELKEMIWTKALPSHDSESPQIIRVEAYWSAEAVSEKLRLRKCLARMSQLARVLTLTQLVTYSAVFANKQL